MICNLSTLEESKLQKIRALEKDLQRPLLAFSCRDMRFSDLSREELARIQSLEQELGVSLVAVQPGSARS